MTQVTLNVIAVTVLQSKDTTDQIFIQIEGPPPYPGWIQRAPILSISVAQGTGIDYVRNLLGIKPEVIKDEYEQVK